MEERAGRFSRRKFLQAMGAGACLYGSGLPLAAAFAKTGGKKKLVSPTPQQLEWQEAELSMFLHFGMNTFTNREWGEGSENPSIFQPTALDARQWVRIARESGFRYVIFTAKHHDGFCLWPSKYTEHSVKNSPWRDGKGDVVREFADACHAEGMKMGLYLSPWDRHEPCYGDSPAYNQHFRNQLTELLTEYGEVAEVWFDGACGEGPNGKRQEYDWYSFYDVVRKHQPRALIAISGPDIRWVGNENGMASETEWSVQPSSSPYQKVVDGKAWYPAECDVSIRPGWFWHPEEDGKIKSLAQLVDIYYQSVGRNSVLLLNVPPDSRGQITDADITRLRQFREYRERAFATDLARGKKASANSGKGARFAVDGKRDTCWAAGEEAVPTLEVDLGAPGLFNVVQVQEQITQGQRVEAYRIEAWDGNAWVPVVTGTTIGHKKLDRISPVTASKVRLSILKAQAPARIRAFGLYQAPLPA